MRLLVFACVAVIAARIVGALVGSSFLSAPDVSVWAPATPSMPAAASENVAAFLERNIFHAAREKSVEPKPLPAPDCAASSDLRLIGTWIGRDDRESIAVIADHGETVLWKADDGVRAIEPGQVVLEREGRCEILAYDPPPAGPAPLVEAPASATAGVRRVSANEFEISREKVLPVLSDMRVLAGEGRIVPAFDNGKPIGFKLFGLRPGGLYASIGLQNGDIVRKIDGYELDDHRRMIELYTRLMEAERVTVDLVRRGKPESISYLLH